MKSVNVRGISISRKKKSFYLQLKNPQDESLIKYEALLSIYLTSLIKFQKLFGLLCKMKGKLW